MPGYMSNDKSPKDSCNKNKEEGLCVSKKSE